MRLVSTLVIVWAIHVLWYTNQNNVVDRCICKASNLQTTTHTGASKQLTNRTQADASHTVGLNHRKEYHPP